jgi:uncharacterized membrane protein
MAASDFFMAASLAGRRGRANAAGRPRTLPPEAVLLRFSAMTHDRDTSGDEGRAVFDVLLTPHRSLSPRGFLMLMGFVCAISFTAGLIFFLAGAWPVVGFLGLDVLLIYVAFRINYRRAQMYETLHLTARALTVRRVNHWGAESRWSFQPAWLQILMDDPPGHSSQLTLRSHGNSLVIGSFLTPGERQDLAHALRSALAETRAVPGLG